MEPHDDSDEELMWHVAYGEPDAVGALVRRYAGPLLTFLEKTIGNRHRAEDLFQEVFLAVWTWRRRYRYPSPFRPWLFGIAMNKCRADLRRQSYGPRLLDDCPAACPAASDPAPAESASVTARVLNNTKEAAPMVILDLPIPAGFAMLSEDLDKLVVAGTIAKYQLTPRSAVVYLRQLSPDEPLVLHYRLRATMPVKITAPPARAYEYYNPDKQVSGTVTNLTVTAAM